MEGLTDSQKDRIEKEYAKGMDPIPGEIIINTSNKSPEQVADIIANIVGLKKKDDIQQ